MRESLSSFSDFVDTQPNVILALGPQTDSNRSSPNSSIISSASNAVPEKTKWSCHKDILKSTSNYFDSIFKNQFQETEASIIFLPRGIFSSPVLDDVLYFMYTKSIQTQEDDNDNITTTTTEDRNVEVLDHLQSIYMAADYLGMDQLRSAVHQSIIKLTHGLVCYCHSCTLLIPQLLAFTGPNQQNDPLLNALTLSILKLLVSDPEKTLPTYWCSPSLACLFAQSLEMETLHSYLQDRLLEHVNRNNAIETLHGCFLAKDRVLLNDWSPLVHTHKRMQQAGSKLLADHFDFYCTKYPKLLSCVDGITYSFAFLDYLLSSILADHMNEMNACLLYKGIVRNLMCRDIVQRTPEVKSILKKAKSKTIRYIASHLAAMKELDTIDRVIAEQLALDLVVPLNTLLVDDDSKRINKPGNNMKHQQHSHSSFALEKKRAVPPTTPWNVKLRTRLCTMVFGQAALRFKVGQRVKLLNRPVLTLGTILYVGKLSSDGEGEKPVTTKKSLLSVNHDYLGVELDRSVGSNDGSLDGRRYFTTLPNKGLFVKPNEVTLA